MNCPSCKVRTLLPATIEYDLPGYSCSYCQGYLLDILVYRAWLEKQSSDTKSKRIIPKEIADSKDALLCPKCSKVMIKFRISGQVSNKLDLCSHCGELWFDGGEWALLNQLDLQTKIPNILSEPWQIRARSENIEKAVESKFKALFGKSDYTKIQEFREWMFSHEKWLKILEYINRPKRNH